MVKRQYIKRKIYNAKRKGNWVVDDVNSFDFYINHRGNAQKIYTDFKTEAAAQRALDLYNKKHSKPKKKKPKKKAKQPDNKTTKSTNPKDALAIKKAPLSTLPTGPMYEVALAMLEGARKYGRHNYRVMGVKASVYYDAAMGHITSFWEGENIDPASGIHHLGKAMACLAVLRDSMMMENWIDDRPPRYPNNPTDLMRNNPLVGTIIEKYPDCKEPFTQENQQCGKTK